MNSNPFKKIQSWHPPGLLLNWLNCLCEAPKSVFGRKAPCPANDEKPTSLSVQEDDEVEERDDFDSFASVYRESEKSPTVAQNAFREGSAAHYRGAGPFDYSVSETRCGGEGSK